MKAQSLVYIYCIDLLTELFAIILKLDTIRIISKPLLMILLLVYTAYQNPGKPFKSLLVLALTLSWAGDICLLLENYQSGLFIAGLLCFLSAHIFYILLFIRIRNKLNPTSKIKKTSVAFMAIYVIGFLTLLYPTLGSLKIPVFIYASVLAGMFLTSLYAFSTAHRWQNLGILGALLFVVSDSILALNKFYAPFPTAGFLVMLTYGLAQLFIVLSVHYSLSSVE